MRILSYENMRYIIYERHLTAPTELSDETSQVSLVPTVGSWRQSSDINYNRDSQIYSIKIMNMTFLTYSKLKILIYYTIFHVDGARPKVLIFNGSN